jgi:hypothetical protein
VGLQFLGQSSGAREFEQFRLGLGGAGRGENTGTKWMPTAGVHEAQCGQAVKPGVGHALNEPNPIGLSELPQRGHLGSEGREIIGRLGAEGKVELARDRLNKLPTDGRSEGFKGGGVHAGSRKKV